MNRLTKVLLWLTLFSVAMGFMETAIVVYLREMYYPKGFQFPLTPISSNIAFIEFLREAATIIMLIGIGVVTGKNKAQRFAFFIYCFAIWDIFYYVFLKVLLNWPESFLTWDILFLIPVPWVGPVLAPCIVSFTMIVLALCILNFNEAKVNSGLNKKEQSLFILGSVVIIFSFMWDYFTCATQTHKVWTPATAEPLFTEIANYIPVSYNWWIFILGELALISACLLYVKRMRKR